jgi:hypothetical protein
MRQKIEAPKARPITHPNRIQASPPIDAPRPRLLELKLFAYTRN